MAWRDFHVGKLIGQDTPSQSLHLANSSSKHYSVSVTHQEIEHGFSSVMQQELHTELPHSIN